MIQTSQGNSSALTTSTIDARISFLEDDQVMEVDFSDLHLVTTADANRFYDRIEERIQETGEEKWFFLVNYSGARIETDAWFAFSRRGKTLNLAHSMGSVRFDASDVTRRQIEKSAGTEAFDPNLFDNRADAIERLRSLPSKRRRVTVHDPNYVTADFVRRVSFRADEDILEVDFSDFTFFHSRDVNDFYDHLESCVKDTGQKWYFLINYNNCRIMTEAWVQFARRGKAFNIAASLGTVRYATGSETEAEIRLRAETQEFRPNIRNTREEAIERIDEMKAQGRHRA